MWKFLSTVGGGLLGPYPSLALITYFSVWSLPNMFLFHPAYFLSLRIPTLFLMRALPGVRKIFVSSLAEVAVAMQKSWKKTTFLYHLHNTMFFCQIKGAVHQVNWRKNILLHACEYPVNGIFLNWKGILKRGGVRRGARTIQRNFFDFHLGSF